MLVSDILSREAIGLATLHFFWDDCYGLILAASPAGLINYFFNAPFAFPGPAPFTMARYVVAGFAIGVGTRFQRRMVFGCDMTFGFLAFCVSSYILLHESVLFLLSGAALRGMGFVACRASANEAGLLCLVSCCLQDVGSLSTVSLCELCLSDCGFS